MFVSHFPSAVLTVDNSVVDLEAIEALYENVCPLVANIFWSHCRFNTKHVILSESTTRWTGKNQETLRDVKWGGNQAPGQTWTVSQMSWESVASYVQKQNLLFGGFAGFSMSCRRSQTLPVGLAVWSFSQCFLMALLPYNGSFVLSPLSVR